MGVFDYLRCKYPLPVEGANELEYQTKDTDAQYLDHYEIREDGSLWQQDYDIEDRSDKSAPEGDPARFIGCMTPVNKRWVPCADFTGEIEFYTGWPEKPGYDSGWLEFSAYFVDGAIKHLHVLTNTPPKAKP